jgi:hypothetical protein
MAERYQSSAKKSMRKFEVVGERQLAVRLPLPLVEVWEELQPRVEQLTGEEGLQILRAILEDEVTRRVGPPHRPDPTSSAVRWGRQPGYVVFTGQKVAVTRPRVRTREERTILPFSRPRYFSRSGCDLTSRKTASPRTAPLVPGLHALG